MNNYNPSQSYWQQQPQPQNLDMKVSAVMKKVYLKMFLALIVSAVASLGVVAVAPQLTYYIATHTFAYWICAGVEIGLVIWIGNRMNKANQGLTSALFYLFAVVNGLVLSIIFLAFSLDSILKTFLITAGVFGAMSVYGYFTNRDLTKIGAFLRMALFGLIICILVNMFWNNGTLGWIISGAGVLIFIGLTAYDTQKIKQMAATHMGISNGALATWGALSLYLDFINLFIFLLRFFGNSRN